MGRFLITAIPIILFLAIATAGNQESWKEKLGGDLRDAVEESQQPVIFKMFQEEKESINVIIITDDKEELKKHINASGEFSILQGISTELKPNEIKGVANLPSTKKILINHPVKVF